MKVCDSPSSVALRGSLRVRLLLGTLIWIVVSIVVTGWALGGLFKQHVAMQFASDLNDHLDQLTAHLIIEPTGQVSLSVAQSDPRFSKPLSGIYWQIDSVDSTEGGNLGLLRSRSLWDYVLKVPTDTPQDGEIHHHRVSGPGKTMLSVAERVIRSDEMSDQAKGKFRLIVAVDERQMFEPVSRFNGMLWLALGMLGGGLVLVAVIQVMIALAPLRRLHKELTAVRSGKKQTLEGPFPGEVQPLVDEFNSVLAQNAEVIERARTQAGNLAHALKTPLSVISNEVDGQSGELAQLVASQVDVARKQIDYHLSRSRVAASVRMPGARTPVIPVLEGLIRVMCRIHLERNIDLCFTPGDVVPVFRGEEQDLQEMLGNLLDNAYKWAAHRVEVSLTTIDHELLITFDDDGCGIAEAARARVLNRGERADEFVPGSGLGLAIVDDLAHLYGGRIELKASPLGGLRVLLVLPKAD